MLGIKSKNFMTTQMSASIFNYFNSWKFLYWLILYSELSFNNINYRTFKGVTNSKKELRILKIAQLIEKEN